MLPDIEYVHLEPVIDYLYTGVLSVAESERRPVSEILRLILQRMLFKLKHP